MPYIILAVFVFIILFVIGVPTITFLKDPQNKCKHEYIFYHIKEMNKGYRFVCYLVCPKCKKEERIDLEDLEDDIKRAQIEYKKLKTIKKYNSDSKADAKEESCAIYILKTNLRGEINGTIYEGPYCASIYKKYKDAGIDLKNLPKDFTLLS